MLVCGWGDHLGEYRASELTAGFKREQYIGLLVVFGVLALPAAALTKPTLVNFNALAALFVVANVTGSIAASWQNIFVPYTMQQAAPIEELSPAARLEALRLETSDEQDELRTARERQGIRISVWGSNAVYLGVTIFLLITLGLAYVNADTQVNAGLYVTTASGVICMVCALAGWRFLPSPPSTPTDSFLTLPFKTCKSSSIALMQSPLSGAESLATPRRSSFSSPTPSISIQHSPLAPSSPTSSTCRSAPPSSSLLHGTSSARVLPSLARPPFCFSFPGRGSHSSTGPSAPWSSSRSSPCGVSSA